MQAENRRPTGGTDYGDTDYGNTDYGDTDYGDMNDGDIDNDRYDNGTIWHWSLTDGWEVYPTPDAGLLSYEEVVGDGNTILLDCSIADRRIVASRSFEVTEKSFGSDAMSMRQIRSGDIVLRLIM